METMKASVYRGPGKVVMDEVPIPNAREGWSLIKVDYCGICGTDLNIFSGNHPRAKSSLVIGHEFVGTVIEHPTIDRGTTVTVKPLLFCGKCEPCKKGSSHVCETLGLLGIDEPGGMAEYVLAPVDEVYPLPPNMSIKRGALVEPFAVSVHAVRESNFKPGDSVLVFGAGPIGLCTAIALKFFGAKNIHIIEVQPFRKKIAESFGFNVLNHIEEISEKVDVVYDCAAHPSVAKQLVEVSKIKGQIVLVGTYKFPTELDLQNVTFKELSIKGTRVYTSQDYEIAISLLTEDFPFENLITHEFSIDSVHKAFELLNSNGESVKVLISN